MNILLMNMSFTLKSMGKLERPIVVEFELKDQLLMSLKLINRNLEEVIELQYHSENNKVFLFKLYFYDRGIIVDSYVGLVKINTKARLHNVNDILVFF